jgi:hypothetical protein
MHLTGLLSVEYDTYLMLLLEVRSKLTRWWGFVEEARRQGRKESGVIAPASGAYSVLTRSVDSLSTLRSFNLARETVKYYDKRTTRIRARRKLSIRVVELGGRSISDSCLGRQALGYCFSIEPSFNAHRQFLITCITASSSATSARDMDSNRQPPYGKPGRPLLVMAETTARVS